MSKTVAMTENHHNVDTVVIGGGLAGLTAAYRLRDRSITVLEQESVAGGRTLSRELGGYVYNTGAQVIMGNDCPVARLADELGVPRTLIGKTRVPLFFKGKLYHAATQPGLLLKLPMPLLSKLRFAWSSLRLQQKYRELTQIPFDPDHPKTVELNAITVDEFLGDAPEDIKSIWEMLVKISNGGRPDSSTPYHPLMVLFHFLKEEYFVEGGTHQLTLTLAKNLGDRVHTDAAVTEVSETGDGVNVRYVQNGEQKSVAAKHCIMATPAPITLSVVKTLSNRKREVLSNVEYCAQSSGAFLLSEPSESFFGKGVWRIPVEGNPLSAVTDPTFTYPQAFKARNGQGLLRVYAGDRVSKQIMEQTDSDAEQTLADHLIDMFPALRGKIVESAVTHWQHAIPLWKPGYAENYHDLQACSARIHHCGDYTSPGFMNGAVLSAERVSSELENNPGA